MRRYHGFIADSARWSQVALRPGDVVVATPSKCGTTWTQQIVASLLHDTPVLDVPISELCPWIDMLTHPIEEIVGILDGQAHRRAVKTHTALDGVPERDDVTYVAVFRHPLDAALSNLDHARNEEAARVVALRTAVAGEHEGGGSDRPDDDAGYLRWWIDADDEPVGGGMQSPVDYANSLTQAWVRRDRPNVHLFHYADLLADLDEQMRRLADVLEVAVDEDRWPDFVGAASFGSMRSRASLTAPEGSTGVWKDTGDFFRGGGTRPWAEHLTAQEIAGFEARLADLAGDEAARWALWGSASTSSGT